MPDAADDTPTDQTPAGPRRGWLHPAVLAATALSVASGYASFTFIAALGDIASAFGEVTPGDDIAAAAGLAATTVGVGLAVIRLASLGALPLSGLADRLGRRRVVLACVALGLAFTAATAGAGSFWWAVAIFALARPLLAATNAVATVIAGEVTASGDRTKAIALVTAGYAVGSGLTTLVRLGVPEALGFRGLFLTTAAALLLLPLVGRWLTEPDRYRRLAHTGPRPRLGTVRPDLRGRLAVLCVVTFAFGFVTGPVNTNVFFYGENVLGVSSVSMFGIVAVGGVTGLGGLLAGRWAADTLGRRPTAGVTLAGVAACAVLTYSGAPAGLALGYWASLFAAASFAPAGGALDVELFPTSQRGTALGWITAANVIGSVTGLVAFGMLVDAFDAFSTAAMLVGAPVVLTATLYLRLPETRGLELEETAPEHAE